MKNSNAKILTTAVILLLLVNIALVIFIVKGRNRHYEKHSGRKGGPFEMMVKELNMTDQQQKDFQQLKDEHFKNIRPLFDSVRTAKVAFFGLIKDSNVNDSILNLYGKRITEIQSVVDNRTFAHFRSVRNLLDAGQQNKFDEFVQKMMQRQGGPGGRRDSTGKDK